jgi:hypothetical protein
VVSSNGTEGDGRDFGDAQKSSRRNRNLQTHCHAVTRPLLARGIASGGECPIRRVIGSTSVNIITNVIVKTHFYLFKEIGIQRPDRK